MCGVNEKKCVSERVSVRERVTEIDQLVTEIPNNNVFPYHLP